MNSAIGLMHEGLSNLLGLMWLPIGSFSLQIQLLVVSIVFGLVMVVLFGWISNQQAIRDVKDRIGAALLEVILFRRDTLLALRAQGELFLSGVRYFILAMGPVLLLCIPFALVLGHLNLRFGARPLAVGEESVLSVKLASVTDLHGVSLRAPDGLDVAGPVRVEKERAVFWRLRPKDAGTYDVSIELKGDQPLHEQISAAGKPGEPVGLFLSRDGWFDAMFFPNGGPEHVLASNRIERISLDYPGVSYNFLGLQLSWISFFLIVSIAAGYIGSRWFGVAV